MPENNDNIEEIFLDNDTEICSLEVGDGDYVIDDQPLFTFHHPRLGKVMYLSSRYGTVFDVCIQAGQKVLANQVLMKIRVDESRYRV